MVSRATREFLESGRTQNQRIHTDEQTKPRTGDRFVGLFLKKNPDANRIAGDALHGSPAPEITLPADLSDAEAIEVAHRMMQNNPTLSVEQGEALSKLISRISGG